MESMLTRPAPDMSRSSEEMLLELEELEDVIQRKLAAAPEGVRERFARELEPTLAEVRKLVAQASVLAKAAVEDTIERLRQHLAAPIA